MTTGHADRVHARLSASAARRWMSCPGSVAANEGPRASSVYADEGTAAHELVEHCLRDGLDAHSFLGMRLEVGRFVGEADHDMIDSVQVMVDFVRSLAAREGAVLLLEQEFTRIADLHPDLGGTGDVVVYWPDTRELWVVDYKHGQGTPVDVERNPQLMVYGLGAALELGDRGVDQVHLYVVQPRCPHPEGPVRRYSLPMVDLIDWSADLVEAARRTSDPAAPVVAGSWCKFCAAAPTCPGLRARAMSAAMADFSPPEPAKPRREPESLSREEMGAVLRSAAIIEVWLRAVEARAHDEAMAGRPPEGFKLVRGRAGHRQWTDPDSARAWLEDYGLTTADLLTEPKLRSPAQIETVIGKKNKGDVAHLIHQPEGRIMLAPVEDPRPAVTSRAEDDFAAV